MRLRISNSHIGREREKKDWRTGLMVKGLETTLHFIHSHTNVSSEGDVRTTVRFAHDSHNSYARRSANWFGL